jgi:protein-S-isoprenylcysteine O-methyltransferase Ste14
MSVPQDPEGKIPSSTRIDRKQIAQSTLSLLVFSALWFLIAGRITWIQGWLMLSFFSLFIAVLVTCLSKIDPDLVVERNLPAAEAEPWDKALMAVYTFFLISLLVVAALDSGRFGWSEVPIWLQGVGWTLLVLAGSVVWHVMQVNTYLSSWVRHQDERGQVVVQEGLYTKIRHPMYAGILVAFLGLPLTLGSYWALLPALVIDSLFLYRTSREDHFLLENLDGYKQYAERVKHRIIPGLW